MMRALWNMQKKGRVIFIWFVATQAIYLVMVLVTLPRLAALAGGLHPFDLMPRGYDYSHAQDFLAAIGAGGRRYYLSRQIPLDLIYPAMFMITYSGIWLWLYEKSGLTSGFTRVFAGLPVIAALADYLENTLIVAMLVKFPALSAALVDYASLATVTKSVATAGYFIALACLLAVTVFWRIKAKRKS